jgi:hypothetical protein
VVVDAVLKHAIRDSKKPRFVRGFSLAAFRGRYLRSHRRRGAKIAVGVFTGVDLRYSTSDA